MSNCLCNNYSVVDTDVLFSGIDSFDDDVILTIKDTCCCENCGSIFYLVYETYSEVD